MNLTTALKDAGSLLLGFLLALYPSIVLGIVYSGSRENGMGLGVPIALVVAIIFLYGFRGQLKFSWTILEIITNLTWTSITASIIIWIARNVDIMGTELGIGLSLIAIFALVIFYKIWITRYVLKLGGRHRRQFSA